VANSVPELKPMPKVASAPVKPKPRTALVRFDNSSVPLQLVEIEDGVPDELANKTEAEFLTAESIKQGHEPQSTQPGDGLTKTHRKPI
jgi:hypothetical protein